MPTVFIAGSIKIRKLHPLFVERISNIVSESLAVIVGDASGADTSVQNELLRQNAQDVTVYCTSDEPRNNVGDWRVKRIQSSAEPGTRAFFTAKDLQMAKDADYGLMLWDAASTGTLSNVFELLKARKKCVVYVNKNQNFINVKEPNDILNLVAVMSEGAKSQAEKKIGLRSKVFQITNEQLGMPL
ncbi:hypothetical protein SAMN04487859_103240 [Roseovarius lutimaris]|uniref:Uncharacterized protein n=1 Tax=Roseovarius lutimaris TaxID=1005928 RepID=A0A1I4ZHZ8_9RHOB|nr:hypothetical protein [Roseovarius lutimaris]SFN49886.1 hypothetical protein SAMN04487859_103240 [Roseovarius lutimaris]